MPLLNIKSLIGKIKAGRQNRKEKKASKKLRKIMPEEEVTKLRQNRFFDALCKINPTLVAELYQCGGVEMFIKECEKHTYSDVQRQAATIIALKTGKQKEIKFR